MSFRSHLSSCRRRGWNGVGRVSLPAVAGTPRRGLPARRLRFESLEQRQLLSAAAGSAAVVPLAAPTFNLINPTGGTYAVEQTIVIQWNDGNVPAGSTVNLCYDPDKVFNGNETWFQYNLPANSGAGTFNWNTTGVTPGTYYIGGYLLANGSPTYSHLTGAVTIVANTPTFTLTAPASGTFSVGQTIAVQWNAGNVPAGSTVSLCYDINTTFNGNEHWFKYNLPATNGSGSFNWDTTGVPPGSYYLGGYLLSGSTPTYSHIVQPFTLQTAPSTPTFSLLSPTSGTFTAGQTVQIVWSAGSVPVGATIALGYDTGTSFNNVTWITYSQTATNGYGSYNWNTTGVTAGTYYMAGYLWSGGQPTYSHLATSITILAAPAPTFSLTGPTSGTFSVGNTVSITWNAANVPAGSTIALGYDTGTDFSNITWITYSQAAYNGNGTFGWNTAGVAPGTYFIGGYLFAGSHPIYSHLTQAFTILTAPPPTFNLTSPISGTFFVGQTVTVQWIANNVVAGSTINLCYDPDTTFNNNEHWFLYNLAAPNNAGSYNWNTTGVPPGTYYIGGYLFQNGNPTYSHLTQSITIAAALTLAAPASLGTGVPSLQPLPANEVLSNESQLTPIVNEAIRRWAAVAGSQALADVSVQIADLPGNLLGEDIGKTILIDRDAAGYGWFIDPTPQDDTEFAPLASGALAALPQTAAAGHADLLTAVMHEMGHALGYEDDAAGDLMSAALPLGVRWPSATDGVFARYGA